VTYILIEGGDGCGKDTQAERLVEHLREQGHDPLLVREPWDDKPIGKLLRECLKTGAYPSAHAALFLADRMALQSEVVVPALAAGRPVVSIRSFLSTLVYQQEHHPLAWLQVIHKRMPALPTHVILLDVDPDVGLERVGKRGEQTEIYEKLEVQMRVRSRYRMILSGELVNLAPKAKRFIVDANYPIDHVTKQVWACIDGTAKPLGG